MDPFTAIGLAGNIITFIDFGFEVVSAAREIYGSQGGATSENKDLEFLTDKVNDLALNLQSGKSASQTTDDERNLSDLAVECTRLSMDLLDLLKDLKARKAGSKKESLRAVWRNIWKKKEKTELEKRLEKCQQQLHLQLTSTARSETLRRLDQVICSGECQEKELASLQRNVDMLRSALDAKHLSSKDLDELRPLLDLSDQALTEVYKNLILDGLRFEKMDDRFDEVKEAHLKTFSWILEEPNDDFNFNESKSDEDESDSDGATRRHPNSSLDHTEEEDYQLRSRARENFVNWLQNGNGIFHVSGKPGAGKSTLMKYLCQHPRTEKLAKVWSGEKQLVFAKFFFWRPGTEFQKSLKGLLRGLLHCILDQSPDLVQATFPRHWESAKRQNRIQFGEGDIQQAFDWVIRQKSVYDKRKFVFFIDGLDEFEGHHSEMIRRLFSWVSEKPDDIKICVSSREDLIFQERFSKCPKIRLHELTRSDIARFVRDTLAANEDFKSTRQNIKELAELQSQIIEKSEGVFLWVSLAVRTLEEGLLAEDRIQDLTEKINALPAELGDLFQFIFDSMTKHAHPVNCRNAIRTLAMVMDFQCHGLWELPLIRYSFLEEFQDDPDFAIKQPVHYMSEEDVQQRLRRSRKQIYARCRGFLEVFSLPHYYRSEAVKFVHRSLAEYLQKEDIQEKMAPHLVDFDMFHFYCQSLEAELKSIELDEQQFFFSSGYYFYHGFQTELDNCMILFNRWEPPESARFCSFLDRLVSMINARVPAERIGSIELLFPKEIHFRHISLTKVGDFGCHPSTYIHYYAIKYGLYEYFSRNTAAGVVGLHHRLEPDTILALALEVVLDESTSVDRRVKSLGYCFEHGTSANYSYSSPRAASYWQQIVWTVMTPEGSWVPRVLEFEPIIRVFLLYGADPHFWLRFGARYRSNKGQEVVRVVPQVGIERYEPFEEIFVDANTEGIVEFAKEKGGTLSLRDIVEYWFQPKRAKVLQELIDRNADLQASPTEGEVEKLKTMVHLDLDVWKGISYEKNKLLLMPCNVFRMSKCCQHLISDCFTPLDVDGDPVELYRPAI